MIGDWSATDRPSYLPISLFAKQYRDEAAIFWNSSFANCKVFLIISRRHSTDHVLLINCFKTNLSNLSNLSKDSLQIPKSIFPLFISPLFLNNSHRLFNRFAIGNYLQLHKLPETTEKRQRWPISLGKLNDKSLTIGWCLPDSPERGKLVANNRLEDRYQFSVVSFCSSSSKFLLKGE